MDIQQFLNRFNFYDNLVFNDNIGEIFSNDFIFEIYSNGNLTFGLKPSIVEFKPQGIFINLFKEARTKEAIDLKDSTIYFV